METEELLSSARAKTARAKQLAVELNAAEQEFFGKQPYKDVLEYDARIRSDVRKIRFTEKVPAKYSALASDGFNNLRDALDHALYAVAIAHGSVEPQYCNFPFVNEEKDFENTMGGRCKDLPQSIFPLLRSFKPYPGGNDKLWILNYLAKSSKHTLLRPMAIQTGTLDLRIGHASGGFMGIPGDALRALTQAPNEFVVLHKSPGHDASYDFRVQMFLSLTKPDGARGEPAVRVLDVLTRDVDEMLNQIEAWNNNQQTTAEPRRL